jgi:glucose-6-phosphate 1-dehydrogenase
MTANTIKQPFVILTVGASGDWARKEIWPSLFVSFIEKEFASGTIFVGLSRKVIMTDGSHSRCRYAFHTWLKSFLSKYGTAEQIDAFCDSVYFYSGDSSEQACWEHMRHFATDIQSPENLLMILSTPTTLVAPTLAAIRNSGFVQPLANRTPKRFVMLEKPFGNSEKECRRIFSEARRTFGEGNVFPVDHYLVKQMILELGSCRRNNMKFQTSYSHRNIDKILIIADENDELSARHATYQSMTMGVFADMILGHLLPLSIWMAMSKDAISREAEASFVQEFQRYLVKTMQIQPLCWGQYESGSIQGGQVKRYASLGGEEYRITPTFFACKVVFGKGPLRGVPIYIRSGKALCKKHTEVRLVYKAPPGADDGCQETSDRFIIYYDDGLSLRQNLLLQEEVRRQHRPSLELSLVSSAVGSGPAGAGPSFKPYQKLILSAMRGDFKDFPSPGTLVSLYGIAEKIWAEFLEQVQDDLSRAPKSREVLLPYKAGSAGPEFEGFPSY